MSVTRIGEVQAKEELIAAARQLFSSNLVERGGVANRAERV